LFLNIQETKRGLSAKKLGDHFNAIRVKIEINIEKKGWKWPKIEKKSMDQIQNCDKIKGSFWKIKGKMTLFHWSEMAYFTFKWNGSFWPNKKKKTKWFGF